MLNLENSFFPHLISVIIVFGVTMNISADMSFLYRIARVLFSVFLAVIASSSTEFFLAHSWVTSAQLVTPIRIVAVLILTVIWWSRRHQISEKWSEEHDENSLTHEKAEMNQFVAAVRAKQMSVAQKIGKRLVARKQINQIYMEAMLAQIS